MTQQEPSLSQAVDQLKAALADTAAWRMLVRFVDRHPIFSLLALPALLAGLAVYYAAAGHYLETGFLGVVLILLTLRLRRSP